MDKNSSTYKAILLAVVCAVAGVLLAAVNALTAPKIAENQIATVKSTLQEFFPDVDDFTDVTDQYKTDAYDKVDGIYQAGDQGYVFTLHNTGYDSGGFTFAIAFSSDGKIVGYDSIEQNETAGKGALAFEDDYINQVKQLTSTDAMPLISGATITTSAVGEAVTQAEEIFNRIEGISFDASKAQQATPTPETAGALKDEDLSSADASCTDNGDGTYACKATGFSGELTATITVEDGKVTKVADLSGKDDGDGVGDDWFSDTSSLEGTTLDSEVDGISGATFTSKAVKGMMKSALEMASGSSDSSADSSTSSEKSSGDTLGTEDDSSAKASCEADGDGVYACKATGFSGELTATITIKDGAVESITDLDGKDKGDGVGDDWFDDTSVFNGATLDSSIDGLSGATYTSKAVKGMVQAALQAAAE